MSIYDKLYNYQKNIVNFFKDRSSLGLFLDMGLGKTPTSLALCEINEIEKIIIITINSKCLEKETESGSWKYWINNMSSKFNIKTKNDTCFNYKERECLIINYEGLYSRKKTSIRSVDIRKNIEDFITSCRNKKVALILDESHKVKSSNSLQTKCVFRIQDNLRLFSSKLYTYLLSGTPFTQGYIDLYTQLKLLGSQITKSYFIDEYCVRGRIAGLLEWQQPIIGYKNIDSLYNLIHKYAITIKSNEILKLPEQIFNYIELDDNYYFNLLCKEHISSNILKKELDNRNISNDLKSSIKPINNLFYRNLEYPNEKWIAETAGQLWLRAREISIGFQGNKDKYKWYDYSRLNKLKEILSKEKDNYVIFYNYTPELLAIYEIADQLEYNIDVYSGDIKSLYNYEKYSRLSESQKLTAKGNVIISNFASGSTGKNWQEYNKCIIFSLPLFKDYEQSLKRIHRIGQHQTAIYYIMYNNNFLDRSMLQSLKDKNQYNENMFRKELNMFNINEKEN